MTWEFVIQANHGSRDATNKITVIYLEPVLGMVLSILDSRTERPTARSLSDPPWFSPQSPKTRDYDL